ncbi:MAG: hypothetical protein K2G45_02515 [Lachnospiraceae bacterium]|nr:hypothetical protein [Lachnospiraceae bacterium]
MLSEKHKSSIIDAYTYCRLKKEIENDINAEKLVDEGDDRWFTAYDTNQIM